MIMYFIPVGPFLEIWKDIPEYEGYYQVSSYGRVRSLDRTCCDGRVRTGKFKSTAPNSKGYAVTILSKDRIIKTFQVHRLVAMCFHENKNNLPQVNHKNGIKTYNFYLNLEWATAQENVVHAFKLGLSYSRIGERRRGVTSAKAKLVLNMETGIFYESGRQACFAHPNFDTDVLNKRLKGCLKNNTQFIRC